MALQARAEATRRKILDSAVDLFGELGYGETGLADVLQRAGVSKGAFYYHFDSKEAVATAIIEEYRVKVTDAVVAAVDRSASPLAVTITATFATAATIRSDRTSRIGNQLLQALSQISSIGAKVYADWTEQFTTSVTAALKPFETRSDEAAELAAATWAGVLGSNLLSEALGDDPYSRLAMTWRTTLRAIMPEEERGRYGELLDHMADRYQSVSS